jgi:hypothetical protein
MTGMGKKIEIMMEFKLQAATDWVDPKVSEPPSGVMLLIHGYPLPELGLGKLDLVAVGYWSATNKVFIADKDVECLSESFDIDGYHVIYNQDKETIQAFDPREFSSDSQ